MTISISRGNTKTGRIPAVSLPPIKSCGNCEACKDHCYALKAWKQYPATRKAWQGNLNLAKTSKLHMAFFTRLQSWLYDHSPRYFRWHVSGDILDQNYLQGMYTTARMFPEIRFLAFTKMFDLDYTGRPGNLQIVFSVFPGMNKPRRPFRRAYTLNEGDQVPAGAIGCPGNCETCGACWELSRIRKDVYFYMH
jgi:ferredoxin